MKRIQAFAEDIYKEINGRKSFDIPSLERDLGLGVNNGRDLIGTKFISVVRYGKPTRYRLNECSLEAFKESLGAEDISFNPAMIGVKRTGAHSAKDMLDVLNALETYIPLWRDKFGSVGEIKFSPEPIKEMCAIMLEWIEVYELDPRSGNDETRWSMFILKPGEENG